MIRLALRLAVADIRRFPGRAAAMVLLLVSAAWAPALADVPMVVGAVLSAAVAFAAAVGAAAVQQDRTAVLVRNGAGGRARVLCSTVSILLVGTVAAVVAVGFAWGFGGGPGWQAVLAITVVIPALVAPVADRVAWHGPGPGVIDKPVAERLRRRRVLTALVVVVGVVFLPIGLAIAAVHLVTGSAATSRLRRAVTLALAAAGLAGVVFVIGASRSWFDLWGALIVTVPVLAVAVAVVAVQVHGLVIGRLARSGPRLHLALAPLRLRRQVLAPLVAVATLAMSAAVADAVVGSSFGAREANRLLAHATVGSPAGTDPDQAIVPVPPVDVATLQREADEAVAGRGATAVVIEQVGTGDFGSPWGVLDGPEPCGRTCMVFRAAGTAETTVSLDGIDPGDHGLSPRWLGVVAPDDLRLLGWGSAARPLASGSVVLVSGVEPFADGTVQVSTGASTLTRHAVMVGGGRPAMLLPGALVSEAEANRLASFTTAARVVVVPAGGVGPSPSARELVTLGRRIQDRARELPVARPAGLTAAQARSFDAYVDRVRSSWGTAAGTVASGAHLIRVADRGGPLNAIPYFPATTAQARRAVVAPALLAVVIVLAVVFLALGATRREDAVLAVQGASGRVRSMISALQAAVVTASATVTGAALGVAVPAACFARYNDGADLPPIPLVVPRVVWIVVVAVPVVATALAAVLPLLGRRSRPSDPADLSDGVLSLG